MRGAALHVGVERSPAGDAFAAVEQDFSLTNCFCMVRQCHRVAIVGGITGIEHAPGTAKCKTVQTAHGSHEADQMIEESD